MPPPYLTAELPETLLLAISSVPCELEMPAPSYAELSETVLPVIVSVP